ncbi:hypothetical protein QYF36_018930 [Acer negundo]|nr:hypothetical protein QYF36_018930 [Acer negundo]
MAMAAASVEINGPWWHDDLSACVSYPPCLKSTGNNIKGKKIKLTDGVGDGVRDEDSDGDGGVLEDRWWDDWNSREITSPSIGVEKSREEAGNT